MTLLKNTYFGSENEIEIAAGIPFPSTDAEAPEVLLASCPAHKKTPLHEKPELAAAAGVGSVFLKDETVRMGLGSFKALGAAYVIAHQASETGAEDLSTSLKGQTFVTASAGNHGLSVAAGAKVFGAKAVIFLAETVPAAFGDRLRELGAEVHVTGKDYDESLVAALKYAEDNSAQVLSDTSWDGYHEFPHRLMEGYLVSAKEAVGQMKEVPTHIFLQAGVGGLAGAMAAYFRKAWGSEPVITVVEPDRATALQSSIKAGKSVYAEGPVSNMGRLDCKEPSLIALRGLARDANYFLTVSDELGQETTDRLSNAGIGSTPSGVGGLTGLYAGENEALGLDETSRVLCIVSEGAE